LEEPLQNLSRYRTISVLSLAAAALLFALYFMPASLVDDRPNVVVSMLLIWAALGVASWSGFKAWPRTGRLRTYEESPRPASSGEWHASNNPLEEPVEEAHLDDVPEAPADHIVRGYGAMNPTEGNVEGKRFPPP
jgi:hypothetical protein